MSGAARTAVRRVAAPGIVLAGVVALLTGAIGLGARVPTDALLPGVGNVSREQYARDAIGSLAPVQTKFVQDRLGTTEFTKGIDVVTTTTTPRARVAPPPAPESIKGTGGGLFAPGGWVLQVSMVPNASTVATGGQIRYRMRVQNTGNEEFRGRPFTLQWHTPGGTIGRNTLDQCEILPIALVQTVCRIPRLSVSNGDDAVHERFNSAGLVTIGPGDAWVRDWYVTILPTTPAGAVINNHAHLTVSIDGRPVTVGSDNVAVRVG